MMEKYKLNDKEFTTTNSKITGQEILEQGNFKPVENYELLKKINEKGFEPIQINEMVDLREPGIEGFYAKAYTTASITIDDKDFKVDSKTMTPIEILNLANIDTNKFFLKQIQGEVEIGYMRDKNHKIEIVNNAVFTSVELIIDIEECEEGEEIPKGCAYKIKVDGEKYIVKSEYISGKAILILAEKNPPERFQLNQKFKGGRVKKIAYDENVDLTTPGIERFMTLPLDQTEG